MHRHSYRQYVTPYNQSITIANQVARESRHVSLCAGNSANLLCRSHLGCQKWCPANSTCHKCAPPIACQFCYNNVKKCKTSRKCHPLC